MTEHTDLYVRTSPEEPEEGVDVAKIVLSLWQHRKGIAWGTAIFTLLGILYAIFATPVYNAKAIITPKEVDQGGGASRMFSQFGGAAAGLLGSQFGIGGNGLVRLEVILKSRELAEVVIQENNLLPRLFPDLWDTTLGRWKSDNPRKVPKLKTGVKFLTMGSLNVSANGKSDLLTVEASASDSLLARDIVDYYLVALADKIRHDVTTGADMNRKYLELQLESTYDPILSEKIRSMIAFEIEKSMLVSYQVFDVLDMPTAPYERSSPKRKKIVVLWFLMGFIFSIAGVFAAKLVKNFKASIADAADRSTS